MMERWTLPEGWGWIRLGEVSQIIMGQSPPGNTYNNTGNGLPFFQGKADFGEVQPIPRKWCTQPTKISDVGDVLISVRAPVGPVNLTAEKCIIGRGLAAIRPETNIETKYLFYLLHAFKNLIESMGTGSTFQAISKRDLQSFEIPIPYPDDPARSLAEQRRIVARLEALLGEVKALREQVQTMWRDVNRLMESALAEVFPAAGQPLPEGWEWKDMPEVCLINPKRPRIQRDDKNPTSFIPMQAVDDRTGTIIDLQIRPYGEVKRGYTYFEENDVLMAKITPSMENGKAAIARNLIDGIGFGTTEFHVFRPRSNILPEWIFYFIRRKVFRETAKMSFRGAVGQQRVPEEFLLTQKIPLPNPNDPERSLAEQRRIVAYLDGIQQTVREAQELIQSDLRAIEQLEQSILAAAFRGEL